MEAASNVRSLSISPPPPNTSISSSPVTSGTGENDTVSRLSAILGSNGVSNFLFKRVASDYYDWPIESRRDVLGAASVDHLCQSIVLYTARFNAETVKKILYSLNNGKIPKKKFNLSLAPEETSIKLIGFEHNAVTCISGGDT